jgi:release factor glutamine methyltransferase
VTETVRATLARALGTLGGEGARSDAEELLSRVLGCGRGDLAVRGDSRLGAEQIALLDRWLERRRAGEPVQYITGRAAFRGLDLAVTPAVLVPRPETEVLVEEVLRVLRSESARWPAPHVLDLGTGSGAIALSIAQEHAAADLWGTDSSAAALDVAAANAARLGLADRVRWLEGDWFDALASEEALAAGVPERFEAVVANPPYIATGEWDRLPRDVREHEPAAALFSGPTGLEALRDLVDLSPDHLAPDGLLALEVAEARASEVHAWLDGAREWRSVRLAEDLAGRPRVLLARRAPSAANTPAGWRTEAAERRSRP